MKRWLFLLSLIICATMSGMDSDGNGDESNSTSSTSSSGTIYENCFYKEAQEYFTHVSEEDLTEDFSTVIKNFSLSDDERINFARVVVLMGRAAQYDDAKEYVRCYNFLTDCVTD